MALEVDHLRAGGVELVVPRRSGGVLRIDELFAELLRNGRLPRWWCRSGAACGGNRGRRGRHGWNTKEVIWVRVKRSSLLRVVLLLEGGPVLLSLEGGLLILLRRVDPFSLDGDSPLLVPQVRPLLKGGRSLASTPRNEPYAPPVEGPLLLVCGPFSSSNGPEGVPFLLADEDWPLFHLIRPQPANAYPNSWPQSC